MSDKNNMGVHFSSKSDDWETPESLFVELNVQYGPFDLDVCASDKNHKCIEYFDEEVDGLKQIWSLYGRRCWMNPPYGREIGKWVEKAWKESNGGCRVVALLPARTDTRWFHTYIYNNPNAEIDFLRGRLKFGSAKNSAPFPSMVVVFQKPEPFTF